MFSLEEEWVEEARKVIKGWRWSEAKQRGEGVEIFCNFEGQAVQKEEEERGNGGKPGGAWRVVGASEWEVKRFWQNQKDHRGSGEGKGKG